MSYVTEDKRVQLIVYRLHIGKVSYDKTAQSIRDLPPEGNAEFGYLDWEVNESLMT